VFAEIDAIAASQTTEHRWRSRSAEKDDCGEISETQLPKVPLHPRAADYSDEVFLDEKWIVFFRKEAH
jgi:hypothetical protein